MFNRIGSAWILIVVLMTLLASLGTRSEAAQQPAARLGSVCGSVGEAQADLCVALETRRCGLTADSEEFWFCKGVLERQCGVIEGANYWFCEALRTRECGVVSGNRYQLCQAILQRDCDLAAASTRWMCVVLRDEFSDV